MHERLKARKYENTYRFQGADAANETSSLPFGLCRNTRPSLSSEHHKYNIHGYESLVTQLEEKDLTTRTSPSFSWQSIIPSDKRRSTATHQ